MSQQINLFNPAFGKQRKPFSLLSMLETMGAVIAGSLLFYGYAVYQVDLMGKQLLDSTKRYNMEQVRLANYVTEFPPQQTGQELQSEVQELERQVADQSELMAVINSDALGNTTGYSEYMRAFSRQVLQGVWLTGFKMTEGGSQISLNGGVLNPGLLATYIQRLSNESVMRGKTFATLQMRQTATDPSMGAASRYVEFSLHSGPVTEVKK